VDSLRFAGRRLAAVAAAFVVVAGPGAAEAAGKRRPAREAAQPTAAPLPAARLAQLREALQDEEESKVAEAVKALAESGAPNAAEPLVELLAAGTTPWIATAALEAVGKAKDPRAIQVLTLYAGNRNGKTRVAAVKALGALPDGRVVGTLLERLGDQDPEVRAAAATALAARKETIAVDRLFKLVARNDAGAAAPLGALAPPELAPRIAELKGSVDDGVIAAAYGELLKRSDVPDRLRLDVVRTLGHIPGAAATTALVEYLSTVPEAENRPSKDEAQRLVDARSLQR
jgi:HEAT repeat protein